MERIHRGNGIKAESVRMVKSGMSQAAVAMKLGLPKSTVSNWCRHPDFKHLRATKANRPWTTTRRKTVEQPDNGAEVHILETAIAALGDDDRKAMLELLGVDHRAKVTELIRYCPWCGSKTGGGQS